MIPSSCESSGSYTKEISENYDKQSLTISEMTTGKTRQRRRRSSRKSQQRKRSSVNIRQLSSDVVLKGSVSVTASEDNQSGLSLVQSGNGSIVIERIDEEEPAAMVHQFGSNVLCSYQSGTNGAVIGDELPPPDVNDSGVSASMIVAPKDVHQCGLIPTSSKDASLNVQENDSMELSVADGSDGGSTLVNVTPMEYTQSGLSLDTCGDKVIEIDLIEL